MKTKSRVETKWKQRVEIKQSLSLGMNTVVHSFTLHGFNYP